MVIFLPAAHAGQIDQTDHLLIGHIYQTDQIDQIDPNLLLWDVVQDLPMYSTDKTQGKCFRSTVET